MLAVAKLSYEGGYLVQIMHPIGGSLIDDVAIWYLINIETINFN
jgi:hypothetical protein